MKIAISLENQSGLSSRVSHVFGRCHYFMFIDPENQSFEIKENPAHSASGGAGIQAAQFIADQKPAAVISGRIGPKAETVIASAGIPIYQFSDGSAAEAIHSYAHNQLKRLVEADGHDHAGLK